MGSIKSISEQISRLYSRSVDKENNNTTLNWKEVKPLVSQEINSIIGAQLVNLNEMDVSLNVTSGMLARYNVAVLSRGTGENIEYFSRLPVYPIRLKNNLGIFRVGVPNKFKAPFIIIPEIYWDLLDSMEEGFLEGNVGVIPAGDNESIYSVNPNVTQVQVSLIVNDTDKFGDDDELPITADMEATVIRNVMLYFRPEIERPKDVVSVEEQKTVINQE